VAVTPAGMAKAAKPGDASGLPRRTDQGAGWWLQSCAASAPLPMPP